MIEVNSKWTKMAPHTPLPHLYEMMRLTDQDDEIVASIGLTPNRHHLIMSTALPHPDDNSAPLCYTMAFNDYLELAATSCLLGSGVIMEGMENVKKD